jgi:adenylylsulfate kinase-like enzyme
LEIARLAAAANVAGRAAVVCAITHLRETRDCVRARLRRFMEVHLHCPVDVAARRDRKGQYALARSGRLANFVGVTEPYEVSEHPELTLDTALLSEDECASRLISAALRFIEGPP